MKIVGFGICGAGEADRYMRKTMEEFKRLCDEVYICCNNATQKEIDLIEEYGFDYREDNRTWGIDQPNIKTDHLKALGDKYNPDWIIALDMDEVFAPEFTREIAEHYATEYREIAYHFLVVNLYNDEEHFAHGAGIQRFWNVRFFKYMPEYGLQYQRKSLHCGLAPPIMYQYGWYAPFYLLHYGLMKKEDRMRKVERYQKFDPNSKFKNKVYYDDLAREMPMHKFEPENLLNKIRASQEGQPRDTPKSIPYE